MYKLLNSVFRTVSTVTPVLVLTFVNTDAPTYRLSSAIATGFFALVAIAGHHHGEIKSSFLQLLLIQTWVKCTSLDSSRWVVYSGIRFKAIRAASKKLKQDK